MTDIRYSTETVKQVARQVRKLGTVLLLLSWFGHTQRLDANICSLDQSPPWDRVLGSAGITRDTSRFDVLDMENFGGHLFVLPFFNAVHQDPLRIPAYSRLLRQNVLTAAPSVADLVMLGGLRIGEGTRRNLLGDPISELVAKSKSPNALVDAIIAVQSSAKVELSAADKKKLIIQAATVPADVREAAALILFAELKASEWRARAFEGASETALLGLSRKVRQNEFDSDIRAWMRRVDLKSLLTGGIDLAFAVDRAAASLAARKGGERFRFSYNTTPGVIELNGAANDSYRTGVNFLLTIDTGGDDRYRHAGSGGYYDGARSSCGVSIDVSGNDRYVGDALREETPVAETPQRRNSGLPAFGAGILGYGYLVDIGGDDLYRSLDCSLGAGIFGIGVLHDRAGNDRYDCYRNGSGSATFGVGILADLQGSDEYRCFTRSQGFGGTKGFGLLLDAREENDLYEANDAVIDFPSAQDKAHNSSLSQGCGFGRRADYSDGHSLAGGIGVLADQGGSNRFRAGLFAQGAGYWYGAGYILSGVGTDTYNGVWYVQGASAHFAVGVLDDAGGNDSYMATHNMAQGAGHDFGPGFLIDRSGNDRYAAPNLSLGGGNANGFGLFWDLTGDDIYVVPRSTTLGRASIEASGTGSIRERNLTLGIFLDTGGRDEYPAEMPWAKNDRGWTMDDSGPGTIPSMRGAGLDLEAPRTPEPK